MWSWKLKPLLEDLGDSCIVSREVQGGFRQFSLRRTLDECNNHLYEVVLPTRPCILFFDIECSMIAQESEASGPEIILALTQAVACLMGDHEPLVLDSSGPSKLSYHVMFPSLVFENCHQAMHDWVLDFVKGLPLDSVLLYKYRVDYTKGSQWKHCIDLSVYTRFRNWRMAYQSKKNSPRVLKPVGGPGNPKDYLVQPQGLPQGISYRSTKVHSVVLPLRPFRPPATSMDPLALLNSIPCDLPYDPWYKIGAAFRNLGGSYTDFSNWSLGCEYSDWCGWKNMRLGLPTLLKYSAHYTNSDTHVLFREAFGLNPSQFGCTVSTIQKQYCSVSSVTFPTKGVLLKSRTGTGKSTLAFEFCRQLLESNPSGRILYVVSSRALAWSSCSTFNSKWDTYMFDKEVPSFTCYMSKRGPLASVQCLCVSIQS